MTCNLFEVYFYNITPHIYMHEPTTRIPIVIPIFLIVMHDITNLLHDLFYIFQVNNTGLY